MAISCAPGCRDVACRASPSKIAELKLPLAKAWRLAETREAFLRLSVESIVGEKKKSTEIEYQ